MIFTGNKILAQRNFYTQNSNFAVDFDFSVTTNKDRYEIGLTGNNSLYFVLESGKIFYNDIFIHSYLKNEDNLLSIEITDDNLNIKKNQIPLVYGMSKDTGNYNSVFFKRSDTGSNMEFDFSISGNNLPIYSIDRIGYYSTEGQSEVYGLINNLSGFDIRIFQSDSFSLQNLSYSGYTGSISQFDGKKFSYFGNLSEFDYSQPIFTTFNSNFGLLSVNFYIKNTTNLYKFIALDDIDDFSFNSSNKINRTLYYTNFSGNLGGADFETELNFKLEYISGSGFFQVNNFAESASFTGNAYGNIFESGIVTGLANIETGNTNVSGVYGIYFNRFQWATGLATGFFSGVGSGMSSGNNYTGLAYGPFTGLATGIIYNGSGTLLFNGIRLSGISVGESYSINYESYINSTGYLNISGLNNSDYIYIGSDSTPIIKGLQYNNITGLSYYLNNNDIHNVKSLVLNDIIYLESKISGSNGNNIFIRNANCNIGAPVGFSDNLIGGLDVGSTGNIVYAIGGFAGKINTTITGSGDYKQFSSGNENGVFSFQRTFTGSWDLLTGLNHQSLVSVDKNSSIISGGGIFQPNSNVAFQINHNDSQFNQEGVKLTISGRDVINPIIKTISQ